MVVLLFMFLMFIFIVFVCFIFFHYGFSCFIFSEFWLFVLLLPLESICFFCEPFFVCFSCFFVLVMFFPFASGIVLGDCHKQFCFRTIFGIFFMFFPLWLFVPLLPFELSRRIAKRSFLSNPFSFFVRCIFRVVYLFFLPLDLSW